MSLKDRFYILFLLGFLLAPIGDYYHVVSGTLAYPPNPFPIMFLKSPLWFPLLIGLSMGVLACLYPILDKSLRVQIRINKFPRALLGVSLAIALYIASSYLPWKNAGYNDFVLALSAIILWWVFDRSKTGLILGGLMAFLGTATEWILVKWSVFYYLPTADHLDGVASWLPWLYFGATTTVGGLSRSLGALEYSVLKIFDEADI
ncbi:MAG: hypothetical protein H7A32_02250 [Deltaproteobacteria bacterium]|nr:hypothetical protein [Deltaproteobacteria bacterium]